MRIGMKTRRGGRTDGPVSNTRPPTHDKSQRARRGRRKKLCRETGQRARQPINLPRASSCVSSSLGGGLKQARTSKKPGDLTQLQSERSQNLALVKFLTSTRNIVTFFLFFPAIAELPHVFDPFAVQYRWSISVSSLVWSHISCLLDDAWIELTAIGENMMEFRVPSTISQYF